jgi:hypothetical protein
MAVPNKIKIERAEGYRTDTIGVCQDGRQFMAFVTASLPLEKFRDPGGWQRHKLWHAVLHTFDADGTHLNTEVWTAGSTADGEREVVARAEERLTELLMSLGVVTYKDVTVSLFCTEIEGREFGLIDVSEPQENYEAIDLIPNDLRFFSPWDGTYST